MVKTVKAKKSFTDGRIFSPLLTFVIPIILTNMLQTFYNIADNIVVGKFSGDNLALAAIGTTGSLSALFLNFVIGLSVGASVVIAQSYGAGNHAMVSKGIHTAITFGLAIGVFFGIISTALTEKLLIITGVSTELLPKATLYLRIIFAALPATAVYNFAAAALRAVGDARTSLIILSVSGIVNVVLNVVFVVGFGMSVEGVAIATAVSKVVSAVWVVTVLFKRRGECYALSVKKLGISLPVLGRMLRLGIPNALQNSMFSISNVLITSALNSLETYVLSARTIAMNVMNLANNISSSYTSAMLTYTGQNYGARKLTRIKNGILIGCLQAFLLTLAVGMIGLLFIDPISSLYVSGSDPSREHIFAVARSIGLVTLPFYCLCSVMNVLSGTLRGIGYSLSPMVASIIGICGVRILWIYTVFNIDAFHSAEGLYMIFPISWGIVILELLFILIFAWRRLKRSPDFN